MTPTEERKGFTVIIGQNRWGSGVDLKAAKAQFTRQGAKLTKGYTVCAFDKDSSFEGVDQMGRVHWIGNEPTVTEIVSRIPFATSVRQVRAEATASGKYVAVRFSGTGWSPGDDDEDFEDLLDRAGAIALREQLDAAIAEMSL